MNAKPIYCNIDEHESANAGIINMNGVCGNLPFSNVIYYLSLLIK